MLNEVTFCDEMSMAEYHRETGKRLIRSSDPDERTEGIRSIHKAYLGGDPEATVIFADLLLHGVIRPVSEDPESAALRILSREARIGNPRARSLLNSHCLTRYNHLIGTEKKPAEGPLVDFDGKPIKIKRKGVLTPIDAVLEYKDGVNILTLSANIWFLDTGELLNQELFEKAVLEGIAMWQGDYLVFGDQPLKVIVDLTMESRVFDNVIVAPMTEMLERSFLKTAKAIGTKKARSSIRSTIKQKRSFATSGFRWSTRSRKIIYILSEDGKFDDYEEIKHVAKHEFGHALGLGDLYESRQDELEGVEKGTYIDLDGYHLYNKFYNLVMCDHHGPVSNNDIEMVVLAFRKNKAQLYQAGRYKGEISNALGRGN